MSDNRALQWITSDDTGLSSKSIWANMMTGIVEATARALTERRSLNAGGCYADADIDCNEICQCMLDARFDALAALDAALSAGLADAIRAQLQATGMALVPREPTGEMFSAALDATGERCLPYEAPRESGVALECDLSPDDAAIINQDLMRGYCVIYQAMIDAALQPQLGAEIAAAIDNPPPPSDGLVELMQREPMWEKAIRDEIARATAAEARVRELEAGLDDIVMAYDLPGEHCELEQAITRARALLEDGK
jgi:hypothetical protein